MRLTEQELDDIREGTEALKTAGRPHAVRERLLDEVVMLKADLEDAKVKHDETVWKLREQIEDLKGRIDRQAAVNPDFMKGDWAEQLAQFRKDVEEEAAAWQGELDSISQDLIRKSFNLTLAAKWRGVVFRAMVDTNLAADLGQMTHSADVAAERIVDEIRAVLGIDS